LIHFYKRFLPSLLTASQKVSVERRVARKEDMMTSMGMLLKVSMVLSVISTAYSYVYDRRDQDSYGTYSYDRFGYKTYTLCYDRDANPRDGCRNYRPGSDLHYQDRYNRYDRDGDYYRNLRGKVNVGKGVYREINGRDAELTCEFPRGSHLISNIVWERVGDRDYYTRDTSLRNTLGRRMEVEKIGSYGSVLIIRDWDERDKGIYRCFATRSYDSHYNYRSSYARKESVYMEVDFLPRGRSYGGRGRGDYSGYFSSNRDRDYYRDRPYSSRDYGWYRSGVKTSDDTIVIEPKKEEKKDAKKE